MNDTRIATGGCMCGSIRFQMTGTPHLVEYCHCHSCRKAVGAPLMAWAGIAVGQFIITRGDPARFSSSPGVDRTFCTQCGTSLTIFSEEFPEEIYVAVSALDEPDSTQPEIHIWRAHRLPWLETADDLPRYVRFKSDGELERKQKCWT